LACLVGYFGDFDLAEEATAEAFAIAAQRWPSDGTPDNPRAWLVTAARRRAIDRLRRDRVLAALLPAEPEAAGLLALMLLHDARRDARFAGEDLVLLADQDRSRWDWRQIAEGRALLDRALLDQARFDPGRPGPYAIQAAIASLQAESELDWPQIAVLYGKLADLTGSAVVRLNRAVAVAEAQGPAAALAIVHTAPERRFLQRRIAGC